MSDEGRVRTPFIRRNLSPVDEARIFLSSGSDLAGARDLFETLLDQADKQVFNARGPKGPHVHLRPVRWEQDAPRRADGDPNAEFREKARTSHVTVVLLQNDLRPGTEEEFMVAMSEANVQVSTIWLEPENPKRRATQKLGKFMNSYKDEILWERTGGPGSPELTLTMVRLITRIVADLWAADLNARVDRRPYFDKF